MKTHLVHYYIPASGGYYFLVDQRPKDYAVQTTAVLKKNNSKKLTQG